jgi:hypothetical protein
MTCTCEAEHQADREVRADGCPSCGGQLATNQDGWKICHACGWASPGYTPPATGESAGSVTGLN